MTDFLDKKTTRKVLIALNSIIMRIDDEILHSVNELINSMSSEESREFLRYNFVDFTASIRDAKVHLAKLKRKIVELELDYFKGHTD